MEFSQEQKLYAEIVQKAWGSPEFKAELLANPVQAIEKFTGKTLNLPTDKKLVVRDQTDEATVFINIPAKPSMDMELDEEQLDMAAGGWGISDTQRLTEFTRYINGPGEGSK